MLKISVIIPVYNIEIWIERCLRSINVQTIKEIEAIVIDDGSNDRSYDIIDKCKRELELEIVVLRQTNLGQAIARNRGLDIARGKYIVFIDGDDYIAPDYLEKLYFKIETESLDCVICGYTKVNEMNIVLEVVIPNVTDEMFMMKFVACCSKIFRATFLYDNQIRFPEKVLYEDVPVSWKVVHLTSKIAAISCSGYYYMQREGSSSHKKIELVKFPFREYEETIRFLLNSDHLVRPELLEYSVMSTLTFVIFSLGKKSDKYTICRICNYAIYILEKYFPIYFSNKYLKKRNSGESIPYIQYIGIRIFATLVKTKLINKISILFKNQ